MEVAATRIDSDASMSLIRSFNGLINDKKRGRCAVSECICFDALESSDVFKYLYLSVS